MHFLILILLGILVINAIGFLNLLGIILSVIIGGFILLVIIAIIAAPIPPKKKVEEKNE